MFTWTMTSNIVCGKIKIFCYYFIYVFREDSYIYIPNIEVSSMSMSMSTEAPITLRDTIVLSGNISSRTGSGIYALLYLYCINMHNKSVRKGCNTWMWITGCL